MTFDKRASSLWTDSEELHAMSNLYQFKIKVITINNHNTTNMKTNTIVPDASLEPFAMLPTGIVPDMTHVHYEDLHYDMIVSTKI